MPSRSELANAVRALSMDAVQKAKKIMGKPKVIIAQTVKGKGVSFMENQPGWHGKSAGGDELEAAIKELDGGI